MQANWINSGKYFSEIIIGIYPLNTSSKSVKRAKILFPVLRTLVAPILPEPTYLTAIFPKNFVNKRPNGIEPLK